MKDKPDNDTPGRSRREAILGGLAVVTTLLVAFNPFKSSVKKSEKIKMLAEDGRLIEIDASVIATKNKRKITDKELQEWVKEK